jgi:hypothetical protein
MLRNEVNPELTEDLLQSFPSLRTETISTLSKFLDHFFDDDLLVLFT